MPTPRSSCAASGTWRGAGRSTCPPANDVWSNWPACAAGDFRVLLLDEPSSGLDGAETERFGEILRGLVADRGLSILIVEHDMALVMSICAYIYVLDFGRPIFEGTPIEVQTSDLVRSAYLGSEAPELAV